jgi:LDH2 family malate/lactate/ureidoglycolate dehydrogenase
MRGTKPKPGSDKVLIPGDPERIAYQKRIVEGIPVDKEVVDSLLIIAGETRIELKVQEV